MHIRCYTLHDHSPSNRTFYATHRVLEIGRHPNLHTHDHAEITWVAAGSAVHYPTPDSQERAPAGTLLQILPEHAHALRPAEDGTVFRNVGFTAEVLHDLSARFAAGLADYWAVPERPTFLTLSDEQLARMNALYDELVSRPATRFFLEIFIMNALAALGRVPEPGGTASIPQWLQDAVKRLQTPALFDQGMDAFFDACACSRNHATRWCRKFYGRTPGEISKHARINFAAALIGATDDDILDVATRAGYNDAAHFYRDFKAICNTTPRRYRHAGR